MDVHKVGDSCPPNQRLLEVAGEVDLASSDRLLSASTAELDQLTADGALVLDLREVTFLDSAGLRTLLQTAKSAREVGAELRIIPSDAVARVLELAAIGPDTLAVQAAVPGA